MEVVVEVAVIGCNRSRCSSRSIGYSTEFILEEENVQAVRRQSVVMPLIVIFPPENYDPVEDALGRSSEKEDSNLVWDAVIPDYSRAQYP